MNHNTQLRFCLILEKLHFLSLIFYACYNLCTLLINKINDYLKCLSLSRHSLDGVFPQCVSASSLVSLAHPIILHIFEQSFQESLLYLCSIVEANPWQIVSFPFSYVTLDPRQVLGCAGEVRGNTHRK